MTSHQSLRRRLLWRSASYAIGMYVFIIGSLAIADAVTGGI
jgi:hypothetical protein